MEGSKERFLNGVWPSIAPLSRSFKHFLLDFIENIEKALFLINLSHVLDNSLSQETYEQGRAVKKQSVSVPFAR